MHVFSHKVLGIAVVILSFVLGWQALNYRDFVSTPLVHGQESQRLQIHPGTPLKIIARELASNGMTEYPRLFEWSARLQGKATRIQAGEYDIPPGMLPDEFLDMLVAGEVVQYSFTIIEGWNVRQMLAALKEIPTIKQTLETNDPVELGKKLGLPVDIHLEGWFYPDTYFFVRDTTDIVLLQRARTAMLNRLDQEWQARSTGLPYKSGYEALIMASIIEKETGVASERNRIAGVFVRRLQKGMRLQTDPTVIYGMGTSYDGNIRRRDLRKDTPYNTYTRSGLPPTPIAMAGGDALYAALHPMAGNELFFVARGDGSHVFSATLKEHNEAVIKYQLKGRRKSFSSFRPGNKTGNSK